MEENTIYEALGVKPEEGGAADAQTKEQELAEPAEVEEAKTGEGEVEKEQEGGEPAEEPGQTREERARHAAERRKRETEDAVKTALQQQEERHKQEMEELIRSLNIRKDDKPVESPEELRRHLAEERMKNLAEKMNKGEVTAADIAAVLDDMAAEKRTENAQKRTEDDFKARVEQEIAEISKLDPAIKSVSDLVKLDKADEFYAAVQSGMSYLDAYRKVYDGKLAEKAAAAARQQAINDERSKEHLHGAGTAAKGAARISREEMELYKFLMPDASEAEIRAHHEKYKSR